MSRANPRYRRTNPALPAPTGNVILCTIFGTVENQLVLNTLYYQDTGGTPTIATLSAFISGFLSFWNTAFLPTVSNEYTQTQFKGQYMNAPTIIPQYLVSPAGTIGTGGAGHEPTTVAAVLSKASSVKGQHGRGRFFVGPVPTSGVQASSITAAYTTTLNTLATKILASYPVGAVTYTPGIFSRLNYNKISGAGGGFSPLTTVTARVVLGNIRRRKLGRGK
jgi:hypothetical protein